ncbi:MAG: hypothetical protein GQ578_08030, partial [Desulfuromonadaceae bacterium]|nr:hypothetical protein [Desulfuromonadaceae bacterium]
MAGLTLAQAEAKLAQYLTAEEAVLLGQEVTIGDKKMTRADLSAIQDGIKLWNSRCISLSRAGG